MMTMRVMSLYGISSSRYAEHSDKWRSVCMRRCCCCCARDECACENVCMTLSFRCCVHCAWCCRRVCDTRADVQCLQCRVVVGDSTAFVLGDPELKVAALAGASSVNVDDANSGNVCSTSGRDAGSVASAMRCASCARRLGVVYRSTPRELDALRGLFCFDTDKICSYELGTQQLIAAEGRADVNGGDVDARRRVHVPHQTAAGPSNAVAGKTHAPTKYNNNNNNNNNANDDASGMGDADIALRLRLQEERLLAVENMMLLYNERIESLEETATRGASVRRRT